MITVISVVLLGIVGAVAVIALIGAFATARPDLATALRQTRTPYIPDTSSTGLAASAVAGPASQRWDIKALQRRLEARLDRVGWLHTPDKDLQVLQMSRGTFLFNRVVAALCALLVGPFYGAFFAIIGLQLPFAISALSSLVLAGVAWFAIGVMTRDRAARRRREMKYALVSFLTSVAMNRAAGLAMGQALSGAAAESQAWPFRMIQQRMAAAVRGGTSEWAGLAGLGPELGVDELSDLASISDIASHAGAGVYDTLLARASSLRRELLADEREAAARSSKNLAVPRVLLTVVLAAFLIFPPLLRLTGRA